MPTTITALDPLTGTRGLLVEVHSDLPKASADVRRAFLERMFVRNIRVGLIICSREILVLRDTLSSMDFKENRYEQHTVATQALFAGARVGVPSNTPSQFENQVVRTLEAIGSSWYSFLDRSAVPAMVPDVVGNLAQANLEVWDGLLDRHDAAE